MTANQAWIAEMKMMIYELTEDKEYEGVYPSYQIECGEDTLENIKSAAEIVITKYIKNGSLPERKAAALRWHMEKYGNDVE